MRKFMVLTLVLVLSLGFTATAIMADVQPRGAGFGFGVCREIGMPGAGFNFFWDTEGNFLNREAVETNLNNAVANGSITAVQRDLILERYDWCASLGGGAVGIRCGGFGQGFNQGQGFRGQGQRFNQGQEFRGQGPRWGVNNSW